MELSAAGSLDAPMTLSRNARFDFGIGEVAEETGLWQSLEFKNLKTDGNPLAIRSAARPRQHTCGAATQLLCSFVILKQFHERRGAKSSRRSKSRAADMTFIPPLLLLATRAARRTTIR